MRGTPSPIFNNYSKLSIFSLIPLLNLSFPSIRFFKFLYYLILETVRHHFPQLPAPYLQTHPHSPSPIFLTFWGQDAPFLLESTSIFTSSNAMLYFLFYSTRFLPPPPLPLGFMPRRLQKCLFSFIFFKESCMRSLHSLSPIPTQHGIHPCPGLKCVFKVLSDFYFQVQRTFPILIS